MIDSLLWYIKILQFLLEIPKIRLISGGRAEVNIYPSLSPSFSSALPPRLHTSVPHGSTRSFLPFDHLTPASISSSPASASASASFASYAASWASCKQWKRTHSRTRPSSILLWYSYLNGPVASHQIQAIDWKAVSGWFKISEVRKEVGHVEEDGGWAHGVFDGRFMLQRRWYRTLNASISSKRLLDLDEVKKRGNHRDFGFSCIQNNKNLLDTI